MIDFFINLNPVIQALIATLFTFSVTMLGSCVVFCFKKINKSIMNAMLGFAGGVMIAASFWSLLNPAIELANNLNVIVWLIIAFGFVSGGLLLFIGDNLINKVLENKKYENNKIKRIILLVFSITLHNIPEGLAVGVAFGSLSYGLDGATLSAACLLALGIGIQNFPEGSAVSLPLRREGFSLKKSFILGSLSALVEPVAGVIGALITLKIISVLPFLLSFAAGAMIYVVVSELIPESAKDPKKDVMSLFTIIGFTIMMVLDISLS